MDIPVKIVQNMGFFQNIFVSFFNGTISLSKLLSYLSCAIKTLQNTLKPYNVLPIINLKNVWGNNWLRILEVFFRKN